MKKILVFCVCVAFMGVGCASVPPPQTTVTNPPAQTSVKEVGESDNAKTITVKAGDRIHVVLNSTYWQFEAPTSDILAPLAEPVYTPILQGHVPGSGAGTVSAEYQVLKTGTARISASRISCGEALRCTGNQGSYSVTVKATESGN